MQLARLVLTFLVLLPALAFGQTQVNGVRMWPAPDHTRLVFDLSDEVEHRLFTLKDPDRIVIDIEDAALRTGFAELAFDGSIVEDVRSGVRDERDLRVVLDLKERARPKSFVLRPNQEYGHRLVIDLEKAGADATPSRSVAQTAQQLRELVIAIDAGHGGEDPGAIGPSGTREKDAVLAIARRLERLINAEPGMRAVMIRDGDYYVSLRKRVEKARRARADLFLSIHADAFRDHRASGSSVYTLSRHGASSEQARLLAQKENSSDLVGGVSLDDKDDLLASVLLDLSQTATKEASVDVAARVLDGLKRIGKVHKRRVEQAGFRVLKAPDIPSILVETAFISNPGEERKLRSSSGQQALANAMMAGIRTYFSENPLPGTLMARQQRPRTHRIARGETLSGIALRYHVNLESLRSANNLRGDLVRVGDVLRIPGGSDS